MNKLFTKIVGSIIGMAMAIGVGVTVGRGEVRQAKAADVTGSVTFGNESGETNLSSKPNSGSFTDSQSHSWSYSVTGANSKGSVAADYTQFGNSSNKPSAATITWTPTASYTIGTMSIGISSGSASGSGSVVFKVNGTTYTPTSNTFSGSSKTTISKSSLSASVSSGQTVVFEITNSNGSLRWYDLSVTYDDGTGSQSHIITFDKGDGTGTMNSDSSSSTTYTLPSSTTFTKSGYGLKGWQIGSTFYKKGTSYTFANSTENITATAIWFRESSSSNPYTVVEANDAIEYDVGKTDAYLSGIISQVDSYQSSYHSITYWVSADGTTTNQFKIYSGLGLNGANFNAKEDLATGVSVVVKGNLTVYNTTNQMDKNSQIVGGNTFTVSFNSNTGTGTMADVTGVLGSYSLPANGFTAPASSGFVGWKANNAGDTLASGTNYSVTANVTFYAQWAIQRTVTYDANEGTGTMVDSNSPYGDGALVTVLSNSFTAPTGKRFSHWNTAPDDGGTKYNPGATFNISANTVLYAIWEDLPSTITIDYSSYSANLPSQGYSAISWAADDIEGTIYTIKNDNNAIQFQANASYIYNSQAVSGYITKITANKYSGNFSQLTAFVGTSAIESKPEEGGTTNNSSWVWTFDSSNHYTHFRIDATSSGAKYISSIVIEYQKIAKVNPTGITLNNNSAISMDTYGYGRRKLVATVEPFNANDTSVTWGTSDESVVTIADGVLSPVAVGTATVFATTGNYVNDATTPDLKASVLVTVTQALYKKATFVPTSSSAASQSDDYLAGGSVSFTTGGSFDNEKSAIQIASGKSARFTISGYVGMKITGIDMVVCSNGAAGTGSLTVTAGSTDILEIETAAFSDASWNGAYDANMCGLYKDCTDYIVQNAETIVFEFAATVNSLYIQSVSVRYLDYSLEQWCTKFLSQITCTGATQENPNGAITSDTNWDDLGLEFLDLDPDLIDIAKTANANKDSSNVIEQAMARYDLILRKYGIGNGAGQHDDFIGRFSEGGANYNSSNVSFFETNNGGSNTSIIITVISVLSLTALGGFFFIKKRKEQ